MRLNDDGSITLSERNLRALLAKIQQPGSARTLEGGDDAPGVTVRSECDAVHYGSRGYGPGPVHPETLLRMAQQLVAERELDAEEEQIGDVFTTDTGQRLVHIHDEDQCAGHPCPIHTPSDHNMRDFKLHWRDDRRIFERICPHGVGHPDPDDLAWHVSEGRLHEGIHGCDGCCMDVNTVNPERGAELAARRQKENEA